MMLRTMLVTVCLSRATAYSPTPLILASRVLSTESARYMTTNDDERISVTGNVYTAADDSAPVVTLFTKNGCTLCDKVKDVSAQ